jgi:hypothetical protein
MSVVDPLKADISKFGNTAKGLGTNAAEAFKTLAGTGKTTGSTAAKLALYPVRAAVKVARWPVALGSAAFKHAPNISAIATIGAAVIGVSSLIRNRSEKNTRQAAMNELQTLQQMQAVQAQAPVSYMNSASQADVDARIAADRANGTGPASQTESLATRTQVPAPGAADTAPAL